MISVSQSARRFLRFLPDKMFVGLQYAYKQGSFPDLENPETFNEKLQWLKLNYRNPLMKVCVDKCLARGYVEQRIGKEFLIPLLGVFDQVDQIDYEQLPERFVLKATHGSGWNAICHSKTDFDWHQARRNLAGWLKQSFYPVGREWAYSDPTPRIVCEEFLADESGCSPADYKVFCFHGKPAFVQVDYARFSSHTRNLYTLNWERIACELEYPGEPAPPAAPKNLAKLLEVAAELSAPFPFVRVDLYALEGEIYFGEMTFYPGKGVERFRPASFDHTFGELLDLSKIPGYASEE